MKLTSSSEGIVDSVTRHDRTSQYVVGGYSDSQTVHLDTGSVSIQTAFMLIDVSDTTNWKHTETDHIIINHLVVQADPDSSYLGEIKIGFLSSVDATNGDFNQIINVNLAKKSDLIVKEFVFSGNGFHCQASTHFGPILSNSTLFQTDVDLGGPDDPSTITYPSGNADLVLLVERTAGAVEVSITIIYETVAA